MAVSVVFLFGGSRLDGARGPAVSREAHRTPVTEAPSTPIAAHREAARSWFVRREVGLDPAEDAAFTAWLAADPRHRAAYAEVEALWRALATPTRQLAAERRPATRTAWPVRRPLRWAARGLAAAVAALLIWIAAPPLGSVMQNLMANAASARGEVRSVQLPDGSRADLGPDTALSWRFDATSRAVTLLRGEAFFDVRPADAPFVVTADAVSARVLGTRFDVERWAGEVSVVVEAGRVAVAGTEGTSAILGAGQAVRTRDGRVPEAMAADLDAALAWRTGAIVFFREPLARVVGRLERQAAGRIVIAREALRELRVSGAFPAGDRDGALRSVADALGVRVVSIGPFLTILH